MTILKNQYSFVIFDWDGTLMDSTGRIVSAMQATAREANLAEPSIESVKSIIGLSMQAVMDRLFPEADVDLQKKLFEIYRYQYVEGDKTPSPLFEGSLPLLHWLKSKDVCVAIATGKARAGLNRVLNDVGLMEFFDFTICADEAESKPHPEMVYRLLKDAKRTTKETLLLGDSIHDLKMANNAGIDSIGVTCGASSYDELQFHQPRHILERVCHLQDWLISPSK